MKADEKHRGALLAILDNWPGKQNSKAGWRIIAARALGEPLTEKEAAWADSKIELAISRNTKTLPSILFSWEDPE